MAANANTNKPITDKAANDLTVRSVTIATMVVIAEMGIGLITSSSGVINLGTIQMTMANIIVIATTIVVSVYHLW